MMTIVTKSQLIMMAALVADEEESKDARWYCLNLELEAQIVQNEAYTTAEE